MRFFITGGSRGIGAGIALGAVRAGHDVAFTYRIRDDAAQSVIAHARDIDASRQCRAYQLDVRDEERVDAVIDTVLDDFGDIDTVVCNAGVAQNSLAFSMPTAEWNDVVATNLSGAFFVCRKFLPTFLANRRGRFVHISSIAADGMAGQVAYSASKAGLLGLSAGLAKEYGRKGITSNALVLGFFDTDLTRERMPERNREFWAQFCPAGRTGTVSEVAATVLFLASEGAAFVNGQVISITGGLDWAP